MCVKNLRAKCAFSIHLGCLRYALALLMHAKAQPCRGPGFNLAMPNCLPGLARR